LQGPVINHANEVRRHQADMDAPQQQCHSTVTLYLTTM